MNRGPNEGKVQWWQRNKEEGKEMRRQEWEERGRKWDCMGYGMREDMRRTEGQLRKEQSWREMKLRKRKNGWRFLLNVGSAAAF